jgi:hypothetical protein
MCLLRMIRGRWRSVSGVEPTVVEVEVNEVRVRWLLLLGRRPCSMIWRSIGGVEAMRQCSGVPHVCRVHLLPHLHAYVA